MTEPGLRERKKLQTRAAIVEVGLALFQEKGYEATTVEEIAAAVGISPRTFFHYFRVKEDLVFNLDDQAQDEAARQWVGEVLAGRKPGEGAFEAMLRAFSEVQARSPEFVATRVAHLQLILRTPALQARYVQELAKESARMVEHLVSDPAAGSDPVHAHIFAGALFGATLAVESAWAGGTLQGELGDLMREVPTLLLAGFAPGRSP